jgi:hypothetical protein
MKLGTILWIMDWINDRGHDEIDMYTDINQIIFREMMIDMKTRNTLEFTTESGVREFKVWVAVVLRFGERHVH